MENVVAFINTKLMNANRPTFRETLKFENSFKARGIGQKVRLLEQEPKNLPSLYWMSGKTPRIDHFSRVK